MQLSIPCCTPILCYVMLFCLPSKNTWMHISVTCRWTPFLNAVVYVGDSRSREVLREFELPLGGAQAATGRLWRFEVLITTYELALKVRSSVLHQAASSRTQSGER